MIHYDTGSFMRILLRVRGTSFQGPALVRSLCIALIAFLYSAIDEQYGIFGSSHYSTTFQITMTVSNIFLGLLMSFRVNSAFQQWRSGVIAISALEDTARSIMSTSCSFCYVSETDSELKKNQVYYFLTELRRLIILYVSIVFHDCRGKNKLSDLRRVNLITEEEFKELHVCKAEIKKKGSTIPHDYNPRSVSAMAPTKLRSTAVELWIRRHVDYARRKEILVVAQSNSLNTIINQLSTLFQTVFIIAHIPIPFNYSHFLKCCIALHLTLYTLVISSQSQLYTGIWVFLWGSLLFCADDVANEIECPFGLDPNDIDFEARLLLIEEELTILLRSHYHVGELSCKVDAEIERRVSRGEIMDSGLLSPVALGTPKSSGSPSVGPPDTGSPRRAASLPVSRTPAINEYTPLLI